MFADEIGSLRPTEFNCNVHQTKVFLSQLCKFRKNNNRHNIVRNERSFDSATYQSI